MAPRRRIGNERSRVRAFAATLRRARGGESMVRFAKRLGVSYTFAREMSRGIRWPSDDVIVRIAGVIRVPVGTLVLAVYCDRSALLDAELRRRKIRIERVAIDELRSTRSKRSTS